MADNKKIDKALYGPSTFEVAMGALLGLLVGILVACIFLVFKPVHVVKELPKDKDRVLGAIYYIPGRSDQSKGRTWEDKQRQFLAGATVLLTEEELNAWGATLSGKGAPPAPPTAGKPAPKPAPSKPAPAKPDDKATSGESAPFFVLGAPSFRISGGRLQVACKATVSYFGSTYETVAVATGSFARKDNHVAFVPESVYVGSCPVHKLPGLSRIVLARMYAAQKVGEDVSVAWEKVTDVSIDQDLLKVSTGP